ncbi:MAG: hypothetical protein WKG07_13815 [Hymenobacter sp.]
MVLRNKPDYFLRYYKNIQGAAVEANLGRARPPSRLASRAPRMTASATRRPRRSRPSTNGVTTSSAAPAGSATAAAAGRPTAGVPAAGQPLPGGHRARPAGTGSVTVPDKLGQIRSSTLVAGVAKGKFASIDLRAD